MSKFWKTLLTVIITAAVCLLAFSIYFRVKIKPIITANELSSKIHAIDSVISEYGICDFDKQEAIDNAIRYYVYSLDDNYCDYFTVSDYQSFLESNAEFRQKIETEIRTKLFPGQSIKNADKPGAKPADEKITVGVSADPDAAKPKAAAKPAAAPVKETIGKKPLPPEELF